MRSCLDSFSQSQAAEDAHGSVLAARCAGTATSSPNPDAAQLATSFVTFQNLNSRKGPIVFGPGSRGFGLVWRGPEKPRVRDDLAVPKDPGFCYPWLRISPGSKTLFSSDIVCSRWMGRNGKCGKEGRRRGEIFNHPGFIFKIPVHAVEVTLTPKGEEKPIWHAVYAGKPGNKFTVVNQAVPVSGTKPVFKEFCPPLKRENEWTLRLKELDGETPSRFDEEFTLTVSNHVPDRKPRPPFGKAMSDGPVPDDAFVENEAQFGSYSFL